MTYRPVTDETHLTKMKDDNKCIAQIQMWEWGFKPLILLHLSMECSVSYCDHSLSVPPSVHNVLVNTLASTNISQLAPNLVKMYITIRSRINFNYGTNPTRPVQVVCP